MLIKQHDDNFRWKIHEAVMLSMGSIKAMVLEMLEEGEMHFDITGFLSVVLADLNKCGKLNVLWSFL